MNERVIRTIDDAAERLGLNRSAIIRLAIAIKLPEIEAKLFSRVNAAKAN